MNKTKLKYVKYTKQELDKYVRDKNSCISLTNSDMHVGFPPWGFTNFQEILTNQISRDTIGKYDAKLDGIVLEVRNIKVFGTAYPVHDDDPINHINIKANFYVFQPRLGAIIKGTVKHISHGHVAVIIYRVFNVSIRFNRSAIRDVLQINQQISFRIKKFDLHGAMPYIEGELIGTMSTIKSETPKKHLKFEDDDEDTANGADSGISTEENEKRTSKKSKKNEESSSDESSSSDSESNNNSNEGLINGLFAHVDIKQEKLSDAEEDRVRNKSTSRKANKRNDTDDSNESSSEDENDSRPIFPVPISQIKEEEKSSSSSSESDSDSENTEKRSVSKDSSESSSEAEDDGRQSTSITKIKQEKHKSASSSSSESDSDDEYTNKKVTSNKARKQSMSKDSSESSSESEDDGRQSASIVKIKQKKQKSTSSSSSESEDEKHKTPIPSHKIKKEKSADSSTSTPHTTFIPRPIKIEPQSDIEGKSKFKTPSANQTPVKTLKRKRESSISEHLDSIVGDLLNTSGTLNSGKKSKKSKLNESIDQTLGNLTTAFQSPALSSTLMPSSKEKRSRNKSLIETPLPSPSKIKQEPQSEDESAKRKKSRKSLDNSKTFESIESDLFNSFLQ